jgi:hypothetical protein
MQPLKTAIAEALKELRRTVHELEIGGFGEASYGSIAALRDVFIAASDALRGTPHADLPIIEVRSFALELHNDDNEQEAALRLLDGAKRLRPPKDKELARRLDNDIKVARYNLDFEHVGKAIKEKRWSDAGRLVDALFATAPEDDRPSLIALKRKVVDQQNQRFWKYAGLGFAGLVVLLLISSGLQPSTAPIASDPTPPSSATPDGATAPSDPGATAASAATDAAQAASAAAGSNSIVPVPNDSPSSPDTNSEDVEQPPPGTDQSLGPAQLRYCEFEKARLEALKGLLTEPSDSAIDKFNARVSDYNSRCGSFRASQTEVDAADAAAAAAQPRLRTEAETLASEWSQ